MLRAGLRSTEASAPTRTTLPELRALRRALTPRQRARWHSGERQFAHSSRCPHFFDTAIEEPRIIIRPNLALDHVLSHRDTLLGGKSPQVVLRNLAGIFDLALRLRC